MHWIVASHKREGAGSVAVVGKTCRPTDATTIKLPDRPIYAIDAELGRDGQTSLRTLGIEIAFNREWRAGARIRRSNRKTRAVKRSARVSIPRPRCDNPQHVVRLTSHRWATREARSVSHCTAEMPSWWFRQKNSIACGGRFQVAIS